MSAYDEFYARIATMTDAEYDALQREPVWVVVEDDAQAVRTQPMSYAEASAELRRLADTGVVEGWMSVHHIDDPAAPVRLTREQLDWLCVTQRAADAAPRNQLLWVQAALALSDVIATCDRTARDEAHAAHAQYLVGRLAGAALTDADALTIRTPIPVYAEQVKSQLMHISRGGYDARSLL